MSGLTKITHAYDGLNRSQQKIADYILNHPYEVLNMSVKEFGYATKTSASAIVRFAQKLGYTGYPQLRLELAQEINTHNNQDDGDDPNLDGSFLDFINQENKSYLYTVRETFELLNIRTLEKVIKLASKSRRIYLIGLGTSAHVCQDFGRKLNRIDALAIHYDDPHTAVANSVHITHEDLLIAVSYRGNTKEVLAVCEMAKEKGAPIVAITQNNGNSLSSVADFVLPVPTETNEIRLVAITSRSASNIVCDLIFLGLIRLDHLRARHLEETLDFINDTVFK